MRSLKIQSHQCIFHISLIPIKQNLRRARPNQRPRHMYSIRSFPRASERVPETVEPVLERERTPPREQAAEEQEQKGQTLIAGLLARLETTSGVYKFVDGRWALQQDFVLPWDPADGINFDRSVVVAVDYIIRSWTEPGVIGQAGIFLEWQRSIFAR